MPVIHSAMDVSTAEQTKPLRMNVVLSAGGGRRMHGMPFVELDPASVAGANWSLAIKKSSLLPFVSLR